MTIFYNSGKNQTLRALYWKKAIERRIETWIDEQVLNLIQNHTDLCNNPNN